ncbi:ABC transporter ATP-binding protein [bacterium]|nr:ABC transporter ATP-binding protein [bacterium]
MIKIVNLKKIFGNRTILDCVNLEIRKGETMVIMGGSGCGKSTLLRHIIAQIKPDEGNIFIKDKDITALRETEINEVRKKFGMLFQNGALLNSLTVGENVALPLLEHSSLDPKIINIVVKMKLELVGLNGFEHLMPSEISGGMRKRVGLARAIVMDPEMVFYDEPGAGLDPITAAVIDKLIMDLSKKLGITSVVVTHEMKSAFRIADRMAVLYNGRVIEVGTPDEIRTSKHPYVQQFINGSHDGPEPLRRASAEYIKQLTE